MPKHTPQYVQPFAQTPYPRSTTLQVRPEDFKRVLQTINSIFEEAERVDAGTVMDTLMGCVTLWAWYKCKQSTYSKECE